MKAVVNCGFSKDGSMRIRHSFKAFVPFVLMLAAGRVASAQYAPPQASVPPGYLPHPGSAPTSAGSPYDPAFEQTYQSDGLWFRDQRNGYGPFSQPRKFFFNMDYTRTKTRSMRGPFGNPSTQSYIQQNDPDSDEIVDGLGFYHYFDTATPALIPDLTNNGMRASGGFWNVDGSGLLADFNWVIDDTSSFDARENALSGRMDTATVLALRANGGRVITRPFQTNGQNDLDITMGQILAPGVPFDDQDANDYGAFGTTFEVLDRTLLNLYSIPVDDGSLLGAAIPYDIQFLMQHSVEAVGSSIDGAFTPFYEKNGVRINSIIGGRYQRIKEQFGFFGIDSGLGYVGDGDDDTPDSAKVFPVGDGVDDDDDFIADNVGEDGNLEFIQINPYDPVMVRAHHVAEVVSSLGGPEAGLHYRLGDEEGLSIVGFSKLAAMFNNEQIRISGDNLFNHMSVSDTPDPVTNLFPAVDGYDTNNLNGPTKNAYSDYYSSVHLSPLFEQSLVAEVPLFSRVPVLQDMRLLEDAKLRLGWQFLFIGQVADPVQSVSYVSNPQLNMFPKVKPERDSFTQHTLSIGVNWNY